MARQFWPVVCVLSLLALAACAHREPSAQAVEVSPEDATLGPGDVFEVRVFGQEDLTGTYRTSADGSIQFPFLGRVQVSGKEPPQVAETIATGLRDGNFLKNPQVTVYLTESNSKRITVIGAVAKPGTLPLVPGITVVQAIGQAGGFSPLASKDDTVVTRRSKGKLERYRIQISEVTRGNSEDFALRAGDIVFVPERLF